MSFDISTFGFIPPHKNWSRGATVTGTAAATDHSLAYLVDDRWGFPLRVNAVTGAWLITGLATGTISAVMLANHRVKVNAVLSGGISGTILPATTPVHDILLNPFLRITPVAGVSSFTLTITSNSESIIIGELIAGELIELPLPTWESEQLMYSDFAADQSIPDLVSIPQYDEGADARVWRGRQIYTTSEKNIFLEWQQAQRTRSRPSMIVPDLMVNDAFMGYVKIVSITPGGGEGLWFIEFLIIECPRTRW